MDTYIYHIVDNGVWNQAKINGSYVPESIEAEGFIHASSTQQLLRVANLFYKGHTGLILLQIDPSKLKSELRYDFVEEMGESFAHIYGPLNPDAVRAEFSFAPNSQGEFSLPAELAQ